ncbi:MAG: Sir2 family NAD+-dependent deacetylase [Cycloclasticus sp.]
MSKRKSIVVLTGAGVSAESGIKTFRASDGLWEEHRIEDVATPEAYARNPELVHRFYNMRRQQLLSRSMKANKAHIALAELERNGLFDVLLVTQNIDDLHERAGSNNIIHMHGELLQAFCTRTQQRFSLRHELSVTSRCECCDKENTLRPDIVWFGEIPYQISEIYRAISACDIFISIGTSGNVYPAAGFVDAANQAGAHTVELNLEPSLGESAFAEKHYGKASDLLADYFKTLLAAG